MKEFAGGRELRGSRLRRVLRGNTDQDAFIKAILPHALGTLPGAEDIRNLAPGSVPLF
jgi:hypothetical protein